MSGWQRLWVVLTVAWTVLVLVSVLAEWPWRTPLEEALARGGRVVSGPVPELRDIQAERRALLGLGFAVWLIPPIIVYAGGLVVQWVYRGFKAHYPPG